MPRSAHAESTIDKGDEVSVPTLERSAVSLVSQTVVGVMHGRTCTRRAGQEGKLEITEADATRTSSPHHCRVFAAFIPRLSVGMSSRSSGPRKLTTLIKEGEATWIEHTKIKRSGGECLRVRWKHVENFQCTPKRAETSSILSCKP